MTLDEVYKRLALTDDCLIKVRENSNWKSRVSFPCRVFRLLETNDLLNKLDAFFCFNNKPLILFFNEPEDKAALHKAIWNFNESPIVIIIENNAVEIYNGFCLDENEKLLIHIGSEDKLDDFKYFELVTGKTWEVYQDDVNHKNRVDYKLLENITSAQNLLKRQGLTQSLANILIGKIIFYRYLIDRKVRLNYNGKEWWKNEDLCECLAQRDMFFAFVRHIEDKDTGFNGDMFKIQPEDYDNITQEELDILIRLLRSEDLASGQQSLFDMYDFSILPIEFISNVYEKFIGKENQDKESAYYTPTFLVDYIVAETVEKKLLEDGENFDCRILDPSCGSGIFLVESLRRIIEKYIKVNGITDTNTDSFRQDIKELVYNNIYGIDKDYDAIQVAIFSIYLTLLDYQEPADIEQFKFPNLYGTNLICSDAFDVDNKELKALENKKLHFDYIIGNPPWKRGGIKKGSLCETYLKQRNFFDKIGNRELAQAFVFRSLDFTDKDTQCALVLASKIFYNIDSKKFRAQILESLIINQVFELASVRREVFNKSNDTAIAPACLLFYKNANGEPTDNNIIKHIALKKSRFFSLFKIFSLTRNDIQEIQQNRLKKYDWLWKVLVYGSYLDFIFIDRLKSLPTIKEIIAKHGWYIHQGYKNTDGNKKIDTTDLLGWNFLENRKMIRYFVSPQMSIWNKSRVGYIYRKNGVIAANIYKAPMILIKDGVPNDLKSVSAICYTDAIFNDSITSISGENIEIDILRNIIGILNSSFFAYYNLLTFSSSGIEREHTHDVEKIEIPYCNGLNTIVAEIENLSLTINTQITEDEILKKNLASSIDRLEQAIYEKLDCSDAEKDLIDYAINISIPLATNAKGSEKAYALLNNGDQSLYTYAQAYIQHYANSFNRNGKRFIAEIHYSSHIIGMLFKIIDEKDYQNDIVLIDEDNALLLSLLIKLSSQQITNQLFVQKDIRGFNKDSFYIFKPNERRLWHRAIAHLDVNEFDDAMLKVGRDK